MPPRNRQQIKQVLFYPNSQAAAILKQIPVGQRTQAINEALESVFHLDGSGAEGIAMKYLPRKVHTREIEEMHDKMLIFTMEQSARLKAPESEASEVDVFSGYES